eukprot:TRINITY_DN64399_c1_g1_i1.p1 TRINITY_DN64399_c1_g1~~TRINITY_DN64399_c1_g1_i1.p1  ORF type:complete len:667 (+),score=109.44 TRINITY_DN64399_c1_g1_i1:8039-10039(+)
MATKQEIIKAEDTTGKLYSLGLGKLLPDLPPEKKHCLSPTEQEELIFIQHEKEREVESDVKEARRKAPLHKKALGCKGERTRTIRELYAACGSGSPNNQLQLQLPLINSARYAPTKPKPLVSTSIDLMRFKRPFKDLNLTGTRRMTQSIEFTELRSTDHWPEKVDKKEPVREYIESTRAILLAKLMMRDKEEEAKRMNEYIERKEAVLKLNKEIYEQDKEMVNNYVEHMKEQAEKQKTKADKMANIRQTKEIELEGLKRNRLTLKKKIGEDKDECRTLLEYTNFIFSLMPELKEQVNARKKEGKKVFMTQAENADEVVKPNNTIPSEINKPKEEFELSEIDSETEIPVGFSSVDALLEQLYQIESKNLSSIQETQKREEVLDSMKKEYSIAIDEKKRRLDEIKADLAEMTAEQKRKADRLKDLTENSFSETERRPNEKQQGKIKGLKREVRNLIVDIHWQCIENGVKERKEEYDARKTLDLLSDVTSYLTTLKELRSYQIMKAERVEKKGAQQLLKREENYAKECQERLAEETRKRTQEEDERKKIEAQKRKNVPRVKKTQKELMQKMLINPLGKRKVEKVEDKVDDTFDDKYFVDQLLVVLYHKMMRQLYTRRGLQVGQCNNYIIRHKGQRKGWKKQRRLKISSLAISARSTLQKWNSIVRIASK